MDATLGSLYLELSGAFGKTLDRIGMGTREEEPSAIVNVQNRNNNKANGDDNNNQNNRNRFNHRKITLHSFRRFVKSTISDLGYSDFSEWFIGHDGSTYYRKKESENGDGKPTTATMSTLANDSAAAISITTAITTNNTVYRLGHTATWACRNCKIKADKWFMQIHNCSGKR